MYLVEIDMPLEKAHAGGWGDLENFLVSLKQYGFEKSEHSGVSFELRNKGLSEVATFATPDLDEAFNFIYATQHGQWMNLAELGEVRLDGVPFVEFEFLHRHRKAMKEALDLAKRGSGRQKGVGAIRRILEKALSETPKNLGWGG